MTACRRALMIGVAVLLCPGCVDSLDRARPAQAESAVSPSAVAGYSWNGLLTVILANIDWSYVCDAAVRCTTARVDSVIRKGHDVVSVRSANEAVARVGSADLPSGRIRFSLGQRDDRNASEDMLITMVVWVDPPGPEFRRLADLEIRLLRPRRDEVGVAVWAEFTNGAWRIQRIEYARS